MKRERITGYVTPSLSDCYNEHAKQVIEDCVERYKIVPNLVHKEKGIKTLCKELDRLLKEVYKCHKRLDRLLGKKQQIIDVSDRVVYATKYPACNFIGSSIDFECKHATKRLEFEHRKISSDFITNSNDFKADELARCIVTDLRKIAALLLWLHKYGIVDDHYEPKDNKMWVSVKYLHSSNDSGNIVYLNNCSFTVSHIFDRRITYSKKSS